MKTFAKTLLGVATAIALAGAAHAGDQGQQKVVTTSNANVVVNSFGNCVLTKWTAERGGCHALSQEQRTVYFDFNSTRLDAAARAKLDSMVDVLRNVVQVESVDIVGFADQIGSADYNEALSQRRASTVKSYLMRKGLRVKNTDVRALGESAPVTNCEGKTGGDLRACLWRDRRVEVELNVVN